MLTVKTLLEEKPVQGIIKVTPNHQVIDALEIMEKHNIGAVVVMDKDELVGIFSERDYARKGILEGRKAKSTPVTEVMTSKVITVSPENTIEDCMELFRSKRIRHLPVMDSDKKVLGMLSIGDIVSATIRAQKSQINFLEKYITGA